jgi:hypothetical protein
MARNKFTVFLAGEVLGVFDENELTLNDAFTLEANAGQTVNEMLAGLAPLRAQSLRALVWFMKWKRGDPEHISAIDFKLTDLSYEAVVEPDPTRASSEPDATGTSDSSPTSVT